MKSKTPIQSPSSGISHPAISRDLTHKIFGKLKRCIDGGVDRKNYMIIGFNSVVRIIESNSDSKIVKCVLIDQQMPNSLMNGLITAAKSKNIPVVIVPRQQSINIDNNKSPSASFANILSGSNRAITGNNDNSSLQLFHSMQSFSTILKVKTLSCIALCYDQELPVDVIPLLDDVIDAICSL